MKPKLREIFKKESDYGRRYQNYFDDHFFGRNMSVKLHDTIRNALSHIIKAKRAIYFKKNGNVFYKPIVYDLDCSPSFLQNIISNLVQLKQFCLKNNIKLYVFEVPKKEIICKKILSESYGFNENKLTNISQVQETFRKGAREHHIPWVYPYNAFCEADKSEPTFFKLTLHQTDWGAYVGYRELMKELRKDFPEMPIVSLKDYRKTQDQCIRDNWNGSYELGALHQLFNFRADPHHRDLYNYYDHKSGDKMALQVGKFTKEFAWSEGKHKVMLIGTSQNDNLVHFLPFSAALTKYIRLNRGQVKYADEFKILKLYKKDILAFKPDILILSITTRDLPALRKLARTK